MRRLMCIAILFVGFAALSFAQDEGADLDSMFDEFPMEDSETSAATTAVSSSAPSSPEQVLLVSSGVELGGSFTTEVLARSIWDGYPPSTDDVRSESSTLDAKLAAELFFDARPARDFRVFGKAKASYGYRSASDEFAWDTRIFELFSDFAIKERFFVRAGKHTIRWGVGYFFSPADVLNLTPIDPNDPTAQREGPLSLKMNLPFGLNNAYLFMIANDIREFDDLAFAPKLEFVIQEYEFGLGGFVRKNLAPKAMFTFTGPLLKLDLFGEAVLQYGSDRSYIRSGMPYEIYKIEDEVLLSASIGAGRIDNERNLSVFVQYYYNATGYEDFSPTLAALAAIALNAGDLKADDLLYRGRHYLAASASWTKIGGSKFGLDILYLANLEDGSGTVQPSLSWSPIDYAAASVSLGLPYGEAGNEYTPGGIKPSLSLRFTFGNGKF